MLDPSATDTEVARLRQRLLSTEEALRNALEHNQEVDQLVEAMRTRPDKGQVKIYIEIMSGVHFSDKTQRCNTIFIYTYIYNILVHYVCWYDCLVMLCYLLCVFPIGP